MNSMKTELVVALDYSTVSPAESLMDQLAGLPIIYKVGLELFLGSGAAWVKSHCHRGERIFLDLKFHDIPNTVAAAVAQAKDMGVEFTTVHLAGGKRMFDSIERAPKVLGVSVLTSFSENEWKQNSQLLAGAPLEIEKSVLNYSKFANDHSNIYGMVCSPKEIELVRAKFPDLFLLVPGIRPLGVSNDDQSRVMTPKEAAQAGASAIVVGRPITKASDPRKVAETILRDIGSVV